MITNLKQEDLSFFKSKYNNEGYSIGIKVQEMDMDLFMDTATEIKKVKDFLASNKSFYPFGAHYSKDLNIIKSDGQLYFEVNFESGRRLRVPIEWSEFRKNLQNFSRNMQ